MDILSILGLLVAIFAVLGGQYLDGGTMLSLLNGSAFLIVVGGTCGAVMLSTPISIFMRSIHIGYWAFVPPKVTMESGLAKVVAWSQIVRKEGLLGLEAVMEQEREDSFNHKALQLLIDGNEPWVIRDILELDVIAKENFDTRAAQVYESMGGYSPTLGILGAVMGLIHVMGHLSEPEKLGTGIAIAFVATIYGVGFANLVYLPIAHKLKELVRKQANFKEMLTEGMIAIAEGQNPKNIQLKLECFLPKKD